MTYADLLHDMFRPVMQGKISIHKGQDKQLRRIEQPKTPRLRLTQTGCFWLNDLAKRSELYRDTLSYPLGNN